MVKCFFCGESVRSVFHKKYCKDRLIDKDKDADCYCGKFKRNTKKENENE